MKTTNCFECGHNFEMTEQNCPLCYATNILQHSAEKANCTSETHPSESNPPAQAPKIIDPKQDENEKMLERRVITHSIDKALESGILNCGPKYLKAIYSESTVENGNVVVVCKGKTIGTIRLITPN